MSSKSGSATKYIILAAAFIITAIITFLSMKFEDITIATADMGEATLPVVMMQTEGGIEYNRLFGYVNNIDNVVADEIITPLASDKKLNVVIKTYGEEVDSIKYKIKETNTGSLIENTTVEDYTQDEDTINAVFNIKNLLEDNIKYNLEIYVKSGDKDIVYYTKIISGINSDLDTKLGYVKWFNNCIYGDGNLSDIVKYIETNSKGNNTDFGNVDIHSKQSTIGWGDLKPFLDSEVIPVIKGIDEKEAQISLEFLAGVQNEYAEYDTFHVIENYDVRQSNQNVYLLDYNRKTNQIFDGKHDLLSSVKINFGIKSDKNMDYTTDTDGNYIYFVDNGILWNFNMKTSQFMQVFSFTSDNSDNVRERNNNYSIKIIDNDANGNVDFLVYGYMNRGAHEGRTGVSLFRYDSSQNEVHEKVFIPINETADKIQDQIGNVCYIKDNLFYVEINFTLYAINIESQEIMTEISDLDKTSYAVSENKNIIAYGVEDNNNESRAIRIFDMENGKDHEIYCDEGETIQVLGYIHSDIVYGISKEEDVYSESIKTIHPMYKIVIANSNYEIIKEYEQDGIYITDAKVENSRVTFDRAIKTEDGFEPTVYDQLISRDEETQVTLMLDTINTDDRLVQHVLVMSKNASNTGNVSVGYSKKTVFKEEKITEFIK